MAFVLSPQVIKEATTYNPFNMDPDQDTATFDEDVTFLGATQKNHNGQTIVEIQLQVSQNSPTNPNVKFRTDIWLNDDICAGRVRPKDADERDWRGTKAGIRTLTNLAKTLGVAAENPVDSLTAIPGPTGNARVQIRIYRGNNGQHKWELKRVSKAA